MARKVAYRLARQGAKAVILAGSRARGDAYRESDLDLHAIGRGEGYRLERIGGFLVSISWRTVREWRRAFREPSEVGGVIPAWRTAIVLHDPKGIAARLQHEADAWTWDVVEGSRRAWIAEEFTGWAEEVHRLAGNLELGRPTAAAVMRSVLAFRLAPILAVHHRILYDSENRLWDLVAAKMGKRWAWAQAAALGMGGESFDETCAAALELFTLTASELRPLLNPRQRAVVDHALAIAKRFRSGKAGARIGTAHPSR